jgi:apolipoprotein N-acyltransferase
MLICYEDVLPGLTRRIGAQHPQLLLNLSDDAWFNSKIESRQHWGMAVYAAVEQRTSLAKAVNPGISAIVDPAGRVVAQSRFVSVAGRIVPPDELLAVVPPVAEGTSFYMSIGYWFPRLCQLLSLAMLVGAHLQMRRLLR